MKHFFSADGDAALASISPDRTLFVFDFDGTLAPIVTLPAQAQASQEMLHRLRALARVAPVAVVSGRSRADLLERLPSEVKYIVGNHGNEGLDDDQHETAQRSGMHAVCRGWLLQLSAALQASAEPGILIEDKGVSLSTHYRLARDRESAERVLLAIAAELAPAPVVIRGKLVLNLLPLGARNKFDAVDALARREQSSHVVFVGDDDTDEIVFDRSPEHWVTVRVELSALSRARFFVHEQAEVALLLDNLLRRISVPATADLPGLSKF